MKVFLLVYDNNVYRETIGIEAKLKDCVTFIKKVTNSSFLISSNKTAKELFEAVSDVIKNYAQFVIFEINNNCYGLISDLESIRELSKEYDKK